MKRFFLIVLLFITVIFGRCGGDKQEKTDSQLEQAKALGQGGAVKAIEVCRVKAPKISQIFSINGVKIRRVAERYRNLDNRATTRQLEILAGFKDSLTAPKYVGEWTSSDSGETYHYYKPIYTQPLCLNCHGGLQTLSPGVIDAVRKYYPNDKATGFKVGELRGMFVVEIQWPTGKDYAEEIVDFEM